MHSPRIPTKNGGPDVTNKNHKLCTVMPNDEPTPEMIETKQLIEKLEGIDAKMQADATDRHRLNGVWHSAMNTTAHKLNAQDLVLDEIKSAVAGVAGSVQRVEQCLVGDPKFGQQGLIKDMVEIRAENVVLKARIAALEEIVRARTRAVVLVFAVLSAIGGLVTWLKSSGLGKWLTS